MSNAKATKFRSYPAVKSFLVTKGCLLDSNRELMPVAFREILNRIGLIKRVEQAKSILIKPNFAGGSVLPHDSHALSDPKLIREVVQGFRAINPDAVIFIAESDSTGKGFTFAKFANLGLDKWSLRNVELLDLSRDRLRKVELRGARFFGSSTEPLWLSETLLDTDMVVSLANLKTHAITKYTGACKNLFGLLPREDKHIYHPFIDAVVCDLVELVRPQLSIIDGFRGMELNGPIIGEPVDFGVRLYSSDALLTDIVACQMIRINYRRVKHLRLLSQGRSIPEIKGVPIFKVRYRVPTLAFFNWFGLWVQRLGYGIYMYGHRIHSAYSLLVFTIMSIRPILLIFFDLDTLKRWKRRLLE